ncbi:MAG: aminotransferase class III-fold pyridoxal phosphate-dependent enzyme [bacterium]
MNKTQAYYKRAKKLIPGGTQLFSKRPELFLPGVWPAFYEKAKGCEIWDLDGKKYIDMSYMGIGTCILGYADKDVNKVVKACIDKATASTLNTKEDIELAEYLIDLHKWAHMARFARSGGEAMTIAVRIARAFSKKDLILFCGYHGWHDWYLSANLTSSKALDGHLLPGLSPLGVSNHLKGTAFPFKYNDTKGFLKLLNRFKGKIGAVIVESVRNILPEKEFIQTLNKVLKEQNIVLIVDEISAGFRLNLGGAHLLFGLKPDIAVFAKGISNGFPMAAIIGKRKIMKIARDTFISSTNWTERIGPVAALASMKKMKKLNVSKHLISVGKEIMNGWKSLALKHGINIEVSGIDPLGHFVFKYENSLVLKTLFTQLMLEKGFLATTAFYASYAHKKHHVKGYLNAVDDSFSFISKAIRNGEPEKCLIGDVCYSGFKRLM